MQIPSNPARDARIKLINETVAKGHTALVNPDGSVTGAHW